MKRHSFTIYARHHIIDYMGITSTLFPLNEFHIPHKVDMDVIELIVISKIHTPISNQISMGA